MVPKFHVDGQWEGGGGVYHSTKTPTRAKLLDDTLLPVVLVLAASFMRSLYLSCIDGRVVRPPQLLNNRVYDDD